MRHLHKQKIWKNWFSSRDDILRIWSRSNVEGRDVQWSYKHSLSFIAEEGILGFLHSGEYDCWTAELDGMWRAMLWGR